MRKLTSTDLLVLKHYDVLAKYPLSGAVSIYNMIDECEVKASIDLWAVISINFSKQECILGRDVHVMHACNHQLISQQFRELINGFWWTEINTNVFSEELLYF
jgi:hypothetical protein